MAESFFRRLILASSDLGVLVDGAGHIVARSATAAALIHPPSPTAGHAEEVLHPTLLAAIRAADWDRSDEIVVVLPGSALRVFVRRVDRDAYLAIAAAPRVLTEAHRPSDEDAQTADARSRKPQGEEAGSGAVPAVAPMPASVAGPGGTTVGGEKPVEPAPGYTPLSPRPSLAADLAEPAPAQLPEQPLARLAKSLAEAQHVAQVGSYEWFPATGRVHGSDTFFTLFGRHPRDFDGHADTVLSWVHADDLPAVRAFAARSIHLDTADDIACRVIRGDGTMAHALIRAQRVSDSRSREVRVLCTIHDVTRLVHRERERTALERQIAESERRLAMATLAGGMAHDLNNLLSVVLGFTSLVRDRLADDADLQADLATVEQTAFLAQDLARRVQADFSGPSDRPIPSGPVSVDDALRDAAQMLRMTLPAGIELRVLPLGAAVFVAVDRTSLLQILLNLLTNAVRASPRGGPIELSARILAAPIDDPRGTSSVTDGGDSALAETPLIEIAVRDRGRGIERELLERVFEPFFTTHEGGTGMGLAMVRALVERAHGHVALHSEPGVGTEVRVALPRAAPPETWASAARSVDGDSSASSSGAGAEARTEPAPADRAPGQQPFLAASQPAIAKAAPWSGPGSVLGMDAMRESGELRGLPAASEPASSSAPRLTSTSAPGRCILLAEDEPTLRRIARRTLERCGYRVLEAADGAAAMQALADAMTPSSAVGDTRTADAGAASVPPSDGGLTRGVDLIVSDLTMPHVDGLELAWHVHRRHPAIPVVLMSGYAGEALALPTNVRVLLHKPFLVQQLVAAVEDALADLASLDGPHQGAESVRGSTAHAAEAGNPVARDDLEASK